MPPPTDADSKDWSRIEMGHRPDLPEVKPYITSATGTDDVEDLPSKYGATIDISSVAYLKSDETPGIAYCAVLLQLTFKLDGVLERADLPFDLIPTTANKPTLPGKSESPKGIRNYFSWAKKASKSSMEEKKPLQFDVPFFFPNQEEKVSTGSYTVKRVRERRPNLAVPTPMGRAGLSGVGSTKETSSTQDAFILRWGAREYNSDKLVKLCWFFRNLGGRHYPVSHSLIILISRDAKAEHSFRLNLLKTLKVTSHLTPFFPLFPPGAPGWEFQISGNYQPTKVDRMLRAYKGKTPEHQDITLVKLAHTF